MKKHVLVLLSLLVLTAPFFAQEKLVPKTPEELFFVEFGTKQKATQKCLTLMHKKNVFDKLGSEVGNGKISGTLSYSTKLSGTKCTVTMIWTNFCDEEGYVFDGTLVTTAGANGNGELKGSITVKGKIEGTVYYDNIKIIKQVPGAGTLGVVKNGNTRIELPYEWDFVPVVD